MRQRIARFSWWVVVGMLLMVLVASGCTRSKSSGPPTPAGATAAAAPTKPAGQPTATLTTEQVMQLTQEALGVEATQTAQAQQPTETAVATIAATETLAPTTAPTATSAPETTPEPKGTEEAEATATAEPTQAAPAEAQTHVVQPGENLFRIALKYGLSYQQLAAYNGIANPNLIYAGQELKIPPSGQADQPPDVAYHVVQPGENLFRIALKYNMLYTALAAANDLSYPYTIYPGQRLIIP